MDESMYRSALTKFFSPPDLGAATRFTSPSFSAGALGTERPSSSQQHAPQSTIIPQPAQIKKLVPRLCVPRSTRNGTVKIPDPTVLLKTRKNMVTLPISWLLAGAISKRWTHCKLRPQFKRGIKPGLLDYKWPPSPSAHPLTGCRG